MIIIIMIYVKSAWKNKQIHYK